LLERINDQVLNGSVEALSARYFPILSSCFDVDQCNRGVKRSNSFRSSDDVSLEKDISSKGAFTMKSMILLSLAFPVLLAGCATMGTRMATAEERASCAKMEEKMGLATPHDHGEMKGRGMNPMNLSHSRCVKILAQPGSS
jgi:uncharacterized protein YceK